jgi:hypothetical protein
MSEDEQLQAAMRASLQEATGEDEDYEVEMEDEDDDEVEFLGTNADDEDAKPPAAEPEKAKEPSLLDQLLAEPLGEEPPKGARIQFRMPDGKRTIRRFEASQTVKSIYAFIAVSSMRRS